MTKGEISLRLLEFIRENFLSSDLKSEVDERTPLLDWGVLNSMNLASLLNFIRADLGCPVPVANINTQNFKSVNDITLMVKELSIVASIGE